VILPIALFISVVFVYQKLKGDSELVVMESAGLDHWRLARPAITVATAVMVIGLLVSLYIMPFCYGKFRDTQSYLKNNYVSVLLQEGVFSSPVDGLTVYVRERDSSGKYRGILVHDNRDQDVAITMMAEEGTLVSTTQGQRFFLSTGNRQEMRDGRLSLLNFESYTLDMSLYSKDNGQRTPDTREMYLSELLKSDGLAQEEIEKRRSDLHQRILWPFYSFTMALVALAVLLSGQFSRRGSVKRVAMACLAATILAAVALSLRNLAASHIGYLIAAYANVIVPSIVAIYALREGSGEWRRSL
jgi:lipopolysaccharide export system permease protein